jgi:hypothetical protein
MAALGAILNVLGITNVSGPWYAWWSGVAGDLGLLGAAFTLYWRHTCHIKGCWRVGRHQVDGTTWVVCRKHHPEDAPTAAEVAAQGVGDA